MFRDVLMLEQCAAGEPRCPKLSHVLLSINPLTSYADASARLIPDHSMQEAGAAGLVSNRSHQACHDATALGEYIEAYDAQNCVPPRNTSMALQFTEAHTWLLHGS